MKTKQDLNKPEELKAALETFRSAQKELGSGCVAIDDIEQKSEGADKADADKKDGGKAPQVQTPEKGSWRLATP